MLTNQPNTHAKPTVFDELRYGYFVTTFANMLKAIRGGTNPIGITTLAMCAVGALSQIEWSLKNDQQLETTGELKPMNQKQKEALGYFDKIMFEAWLNRWIRDSGINSNCDSPRLYGLRCALVHTGGDSEALSKTGVKAWLITTDNPTDHNTLVQNDVPRFSLDMPNFLAELMLATDKFLNDSKPILHSASHQLHLRIGFIAGLTTTDQNGVIYQRFITKQGSLAWFDQRLSLTPLEIPKHELSAKIRDSYLEATTLVLQ